MLNIQNWVNFEHFKLILNSIIFILISTLSIHSYKESRTISETFALIHFIYIFTIKDKNILRSIMKFDLFRANFGNL